MSEIQTSLYSNVESQYPNIKFPTTRYQGSKLKIVDWIWNNIKDLEFHTCLDAFGGTGSVAYKFKQEGKSVTYNDILKFNSIFGKALIENRDVLLTNEDIEFILNKHDEFIYPTLIQDNFEDIYYTNLENKWLDTVITNINHITDSYKYSLAFFSLAQSCIVKRPYNLFHRKNLYLRMNDVKRSFGNKTSWDKPFNIWFRKFVNEVNNGIFDNGYENTSLNYDALNIKGDFDLVYIDTPYIASKGSKVDYHSFYHFLEGLCNYDNWYENIDFKSKHHRLKPVKSPWTDKNKITQGFDDLFNKYQDSKLVISYRSDGIPSISKIKELLEEYKDDVKIYDYGSYKYTLSKNNKSKETLIVGV